MLVLAFAPGDGSTPPDNAAVASADPQAAAEEPRPDVFAEQVKPFFQEHCEVCHNADDPQAGVNFEAFKSADTMLDGDGREIWEKALGMIESGAMPPPDMDQPPEKQRDEIAAWLEDRLFNLDCDIIDDPGRVTIRRLNRAEYRNTIRDLLGVDFDPSDDFPSDDVGYGFDNIGDVLSLSPLLMEKYLNAAR